VTDRKKKKAETHNAARTDGKKIRVMMTALFCGNTLRISRKSDYIRAQIFRQMPQTYCAAPPKERQEAQRCGCSQESIKKYYGMNGVSTSARIRACIFIM